MSTVLATPDRTIECVGAFNVRDLGGYRTSDGRLLRWRTVFRADGLHRIPADSLAAVRELGWRTVLDLRTADERMHGTFAVDGVDLVHLPLLRETWNGVELGLEADDPVAFLVGRYLEMAEGAGSVSIARALELLASRRRLPLVFHCSAGKDRTGVVAAVLLAVLGVDDDQIAEDYERSAVAMDRLVDWIVATHPEAAEHMARQPQAFLACPPQAMIGFLDELRARHGSVASYVDRIGVTRGTVRRLRAVLLDGADAGP